MLESIKHLKGRTCPLKYTKEQIEALKKYYPISDFVSLETYFPGLSKIKIKDIARSHGIKSNSHGNRLQLAGQVFGRLTVIEIDHISKDHKVYWKCKCICGNEKIVIGSSLTSGTTKSCGCLNKEMVAKNSAVDHTGEKFGMLTAVERIPNYKGCGRTYYRCICDCGNEKYVLSSGLVGGKTKTCGCLSRKPKAFISAFNLELDDTVRRYQIYKHTAPNGKVYIGITHQDVEKRWQNGNGYSTQKKFWRAIQKYGWDTFSHEILEKDLTEKEACEKEIVYIKLFKSVDSKFGYNTSQGGGIGRSLVTPVMQYYHDNPVNFFESHQQAAELLGVSSTSIRNYIKGNSMIDGYRFEELPLIHTYDIDEYLYDIKSEEHLCIGKRMLEQRAKKTIARNKANARGICQYDMDGHFIRTFDSIVEAKNNIPGLGSISAVLKGCREAKSAGGYQWKYDTGDYSDIAPIHVNRKPVLQIDPNTYELIAEYFSSAEAEKTTGVNRNQIYKSCKKIHITSGGYIWRYKDDPEAFIPVEKKEKPVKSRISINQYSLNGKFIKNYKSINEAEKANPNISDIRAAVSKKAINKSAGGYMWLIDMGDYSDISPYHANGRFVDQVDIKTGALVKRFPSARAAQQETGINNIIAVCTGKRKNAGGFYWRYSENK